MKFVIRAVGERHAVYEWELQKKDGAPVCRNATPLLDTEAEARSDIAQAKISMKAARFAKVEVAS